MNVSKGDLARIVKSSFPGREDSDENNDKIVEVLYQRGEHSKYGVIWRIRSKTQDLVTEYGGVGNECDIEDDRLRRVDSTPIQKKIEEKLEA